jgi:transcriptional regulator with XRE-family HTH domain
MQQIKTLIEERRLPPPQVRRALRLAAGFTLQDIADVLGVTRSAVHRWEIGTRAPRSANRIRYSEVLAGFQEALHNE